MQLLYSCVVNMDKFRFKFGVIEQADLKKIYP
jgi:hypothetical protein